MPHWVWTCFGSQSETAGCSRPQRSWIVRRNLVSARDLCHHAFVHDRQHVVLGIMGELGQIRAWISLSVVLLGLCDRSCSGGGCLGHLARQPWRYRATVSGGSCACERRPPRL